MNNVVKYLICNGCAKLWNRKNNNKNIKINQKLTNRKEQIYWTEYQNIYYRVCEFYIFGKLVMLISNYCLKIVKDTYFHNC